MEDAKEETGQVNDCEQKERSVPQATLPVHLVPGK